MKSNESRKKLWNDFSDNFPVFRVFSMRFLILEKKSQKSEQLNVVGEWEEEVSRRDQEARENVAIKNARGMEEKKKSRIVRVNGSVTLNIEEKRKLRTPSSSQHLSAEVQSRVICFKKIFCAKDFIFYYSQHLFHLVSPLHTFSFLLVLSRKLPPTLFRV